MNSRLTCMPPLSACLRRRALDPWSKPSVWPPIRKHAARPLAAVPPSTWSRRVPWPLCSPAPKGSSYFTSIVRKVAACSSRISRSCFKARRARISGVCFCLWVRRALRSLRPRLRRSQRLRQGSAFLWSNGNSVRKCSSNMATH